MCSASLIAKMQTQHRLAMKTPFSKQMMFVLPTVSFIAVFCSQNLDQYSLRDREILTNQMASDTKKVVYASKSIKKSTIQILSSFSEICILIWFSHCKTCIWFLLIYKIEHNQFSHSTYPPPPSSLAWCTTCDGSYLFCLLSDPLLALDKPPPPPRCDYDASQRCNKHSLI